MDAVEVAKTAGSAWTIQIEGRNRFGQHGAWFPEAEAISLAKDHQDALILLTFLRAQHGPHNTFMIANGLADTFGWRRQRLSAARSALIDLGYLKHVRAASSYGAALYQWVSSTRAGRAHTGAGVC